MAKRRNLAIDLIAAIRDGTDDLMLSRPTPYQLGHVCQIKSFDPVL
jgi:hypothetical protein